MKSVNEVILDNSEYYTLADIFDCYTKPEIVEIAKIHGLKGYSKLTKAKLIEAVTELMVEKDHVMESFLCLSDAEIKAFASASKVAEYRVEDEFLFNTVIELGYCGKTIKSGEVYIAIPKEVVKVYNEVDCDEFNERRKIRSFILQCVKAADRLYAVAPIRVITAIFEKNKSALGITAKATDELILSEYESSLDILKTGIIISEKYISNTVAENDLYKVLEKNQGKKDFYMPTYKEIKNVSIYGRFPIDITFTKMLDFIKFCYGINDEEADCLVALIQNRISCGYDMQYIVDSINDMGYEFANKMQVNEFVRNISELWNDTRMIANRGFKPNELRTSDAGFIKIQRSSERKAKANTKVYPNDMCPCKSGKKYKQCCGRK